MGQTIIEKLWDAHSIADLGNGNQLIYIDRVFFHERTGSIALQGLEAAGRNVRNPEQVFGCMDHIVDTLPGRTDDTMVPGGSAFITTTREAAHAAGVNLFDLGDDRQGIVHVVSPEQGIALPGLTLVCPDSHTCTQGALGTLAWGIGSTECEHALATKTLAVKKPRFMRVGFTGRLGYGITAKDMILHLIGRHTASGGVGYAIEFADEAVRALPMEARFTLCNMGVEFGAWSCIIAPDQTTYDYIAGRPYAPKDHTWDQALAYWQSLPSDDDARFDKEITIDCSTLAPQVTWGTSPQHETGIDGMVPNPANEADINHRQSIERALEYMGLEPGTQLAGLPIDSAFIGSCTNSRLSDLRSAAGILKGRKVAAGVKAICVPGSGQVKKAAEAEGLHRIFTEAGFEWREPGCSMCFYAGGDNLGLGKRTVSSTNRNFENRQGPGTKTHLASPTTVAASAVRGCLTDVRTLEPNHG
ncbi:MAG: 3-isopropylmalate dehydratase large subunit [Gammaproteobacteria bacterium]|jgi:3-isopropylmalate/(R)-2-methylmalate dehydratase large subunit|nr:3-isopropylmalate dehydratase large subunit [Chromatiales bacterium]MCP4926945.1 3-isopropylmalate dehydratase large subunit [Gammaproteobacteria bacterium]MDP7296335.1 3-isopropylmalate dehydratase large subunit [Gammaproteobacteria bacterium]MDP7419457.1 3-isopropylmalate dehydratase large subunit [Gammaproteobacteria bacterium]MDP7660433.1 3-isopropylmalate dehydratase large subunit [Gammaproteobacteria bacterium]